MEIRLETHGCGIPLDVLILHLHSILQGVLEEVQLIKWPTPQSALLNTLLVIAIVAATSVVLFGVNTALAELSRQVYTRF